MWRGSAGPLEVAGASLRGGGGPGLDGPGSRGRAWRDGGEEEDEGEFLG